jgi:hypothetical protein
MVARLRDAGLQKWIQPFRANADFADSNVFTLRIEDGKWTEDLSKDGGPDENIDFGPYEVTGDTVVVTHGNGTDTFRWSVDGNTLTLTFVESIGIPPYQGIPEEVFQRAFYTAAPFERQA